MAHVERWRCVGRLISRFTEGQLGRAARMDALTVRARVAVCAHRRPLRQREQGACRACPWQRPASK
eukprot:5345718-Prymnesium_polylepis.2